MWLFQRRKERDLLQVPDPGVALDTRVGGLGVALGGEDGPQVVAQGLDLEVEEGLDIEGQDLTVVAVDLAIEDLTHVGDLVAIGDRTVGEDHLVVGDLDPEISLGDRIQEETLIDLDLEKRILSSVETRILE